MRALLAVTAVTEALTGLALLAYPPAVVRLLLGTEVTGVGVVIGRVAGAALLAIGVACWPARNDAGSPARLRLLSGVLIYDLAAAALLAHAGLFMKMAGIALWPAVVAHGVLAAWCVACLRGKPRSAASP